MADISVANSPAPTVITFPDSPFKLHQPFPPAGDQPTAIQGRGVGRGDGLMSERLLGVAGSGTP
jgi:excinuclease ABC subunit B